MSDYQERAAEAVRIFWTERNSAAAKQKKSGQIDRGERAGVTGGKNMNGFVAMLTDLVHANGLEDADVHTSKSKVTLPGYFRATKDWDVVIIRKGQLIAAIELKSHVGPSFSNNYNNRAEEAIGTAHDMWTAHREGAFVSAIRPFTGWMMLIEDAEESKRGIERIAEPHFKVFPEYRGASYQERYELLCKRLVAENLYTNAAVITSPRQGGLSGEFSEISEEVSLRRFVAAFSAHIAGEAAVLKSN